MKREKQFAALRRCYICGEAADIVIAQNCHQDVSKYNGTTEPGCFCGECETYLKNHIFCIEVHSEADKIRTGRLLRIHVSDWDKIFSIDKPKQKICYLDVLTMNEVIKKLGISGEKENENK